MWNLIGTLGIPWVDGWEIHQDAIEDAWAAVDADGDLQEVDQAPEASETAASSVIAGPNRMYQVHAGGTHEGSGSTAFHRILLQMHGLWPLWQRMRRSELRKFGCFWTGFQQLNFLRLEEQVPKEGKAGKVVAGEDEEARFLGQGLGTKNHQKPFSARASLRR